MSAELPGRNPAGYNQDLVDHFNRCFLPLLPPGSPFSPFSSFFALIHFAIGTLPNTDEFAEQLQYLKDELYNSFKNSEKFAFRKRIVRFLHEEHGVPRAGVWAHFNEEEPPAYIKTLDAGLNGQLQ